MNNVLLEIYLCGKKECNIHHS